jgi:hypothetical protein
MNGHQAIHPHANGTNGLGNGNGNGNGNGYAPNPIPTLLSYKEAMTKCLILAIETTHSAEAHAAAKGYAVRFAENAIQDLASTLFNGGSSTASGCPMYAAASSASVPLSITPPARPGRGNAALNEPYYA